MMPKEFMERYKEILTEYREVVVTPTQKLKEELAGAFMLEHNLSWNQIDLLDKEPPF